MSEERRKTNKSSTGTVPKIKQRNNKYTEAINEERLESLSNNTGHWQRTAYSNLIRNPKRNLRNNYNTMDTAFEEECVPVFQNGVFNANENASSANSSSSASRRNSSNSTLKCDNVTKYPDKKQIEDKLNQIREYLKITNSLMTNMKNTDEQLNDVSEKESLEKMVKDLKDSEKKLVDILGHMNGDESQKTNDIQVITNGGDDFVDRKPDSEINLDPQIDIESLKEQQMTLLKLQQKAEKKLRDARQSNLFQQYEGNITQNVKENNNYQQFDKAIKELEDRARRLKPVESSPQNVHDTILAKVESLHNQIMVMHNANDEREELIQTLDNRDADLRSQHAELQSKLVELQNKKMQVDQLVTQLQSFGEEEEEDIGGQVRKIVTMKDQLKKLKDMLEIVKNTETIMQNTNASPEDQAAACEICTTAENYLEKEFQKPKLQSSVQNETNVLRYDNDTSVDNIPKQFNKNSRKQGGRGAYPKMPSISQKIALQTELESKRRELEDLMGKHKASSSNLNHDVGIDTKSEYSCASNTINESWAPLLAPQHHTDSERFSSDECEDDINHYQGLNDNHNVLTLTSNYSPSNTSKPRPANVRCPDFVQRTDCERPQVSSRTSEIRNGRSSSVGTSNCIREQPRANSDQEMKSQVQKQLQLIKSVCDSMLEQQSVISQPNANVQNLRNNLTPSPLYSESQRYPNPNTHALNMVNVTNPSIDVPWFPCNSELNNYQGWLATNTIQTQSFMLNTLNQCCQMLWLQQRELVSLRNVVSMLQERMENQYGGPQEHLPSPIQTNPQENRSSNQYRSNPNHKINHVSSAYSLPNLNHCNSHPSSSETNFINHNNSQSSRILDPCLNNMNINHLNAQSVEHANNVMHGVNANINHNLPNQMWNGQALNNQVAPGNRANNYWDNFRSYSRQNLLSTKNSEVLQNCHSSIERTERTNTMMERTNPFTMMAFSKSNSEQDSTSTSQENTPERRGVFRHENVRIQPDVLNINQTIHKGGNEHLDLPTTSGNQHHVSEENLNHSFQMLLNFNATNDHSSNHSNISEEHIVGEAAPEQSRRRNEWNQGAADEQLPKSKLFDELRENVYKEVVSLISANESRPHFLIQLFRDLQMIGSDALRLKILQSIQMIATHSLLQPQNPKRLPPESQQLTEQDGSHQEKIAAVHTKSLKNSPNNPKTNDFTEFQTIFKGAIPFLNDHEDDVIDMPLLSSLKQILLNSSSFKEAVRDTVFQKHFSNILDEIFEQYIGKKMKSVKFHLLQTLNELFCGELGIIQIINETSSEMFSRSINEVEPENSGYTTANYELSKQPGTGGAQSVKIQNGDLCEADQTRVLDDNDVEEEGAVGGILESPQTFENSSNKQGTSEEIELTFVATCSAKSSCEDMELAFIPQCNVKNTCDDLTLTCELTCNSEGLDQIPTRLPIKTKSRSVTPNKDRSNPKADMEPF